MKRSVSSFSITVCAFVLALIIFVVVVSVALATACRLTRRARLELELFLGTLGVIVRVVPKHRISQSVQRSVISEVIISEVMEDPDAQCNKS